MTDRLPHKASLTLLTIMAIIGVMFVAGPALVAHTPSLAKPYTDAVTGFVGNVKPILVIVYNVPFAIGAVILLATWFRFSRDYLRG